MPDDDGDDRELFTFTKQQRRERSHLPDGYVDVETRELYDGEIARVTLTPEQAQGWADTLAARLHERRVQLAQNEFADVDEVYVVQYAEYEGEPWQLDSVAFTRKKAAERAHEIGYENPMGETNIETVTFHR